MIVTALTNQYVAAGQVLGADDLYPADWPVEDQLFFEPTLTVVEQFLSETEIDTDDISVIRALVAPVEREFQYAYDPQKHNSHVFRCGIDLRLPSYRLLNDVACHFLRISEDLTIPLRVGWRRSLRLRRPVVHIDTANLLAADALDEELIPAVVALLWSSTGTIS